MIPRVFVREEQRAEEKECVDAAAQEEVEVERAVEDDAPPGIAHHQNVTTFHQRPGDPPR